MWMFQVRLNIKYVRVEGWGIKNLPHNLIAGFILKLNKKFVRDWGGYRLVMKVAPETTQSVQTDDSHLCIQTT